MIRVFYFIFETYRYRTYHAPNLFRVWIDFELWIRLYGDF